MIKAIVFDLDGTIISDDHIQDGLLYVYRKNINLLGNIGFDSFQNANYKSVDNVRKLHSNGKIYLHQVGITIWYQILKYLNIPTNSTLVYTLYTDLQKFILDNIELKPGFIELIEYLKNEDIKVGILSNGLFVERFERVKRLGVLDFIDVLVSSDMVGVEKPDKKMFLYILEIMNILPRDVIYVGNDPIQDIEGAKAVGLLPIMMLDKKQKNKLRPKDVITIEDFRDVIKILDKTSI